MKNDYADMRGKIFVVGHYGVVGEDNGSTLYIARIVKITPKLVELEYNRPDGGIRVFRRRHDRVVSIGE